MPTYHSNILFKATLKELYQFEIQFSLVLGFDDTVAFVFEDQAFVWNAGFLQSDCHYADIFRADSGILYPLDDEQAPGDILNEVNRRGIVIFFRDLIGAAAKQRIRGRPELRVCRLVIHYQVRYTADRSGCGQ